MKIDARRAAKQQLLAAELAAIGFALPGSLTVRAYRCGKSNCRCRGEPPQLHGPYAFWTRKIDAKTSTRMLSDDELAQYQPLFDNARELRSLLSQLYELSLGLVEPPEAKKPSAVTKKAAKVSDEKAPTVPAKNAARAASGHADTRRRPSAGTGRERRT